MNRTRLEVLALGLALSTLAGCADAPGGETSEALGPRLTAQPDLRLGSLDDPAQNFTRLESVVIGPAGEIIVADPQANLIRVFSEDGQPLRIIGAPGAGPGHFERLGRVRMRGDTLLASDNRMIVSAFTLDGTFQRIVWGPGERWFFFRDSSHGMRFGYGPTDPEVLSGDTAVIIRPAMSFTYTPPACAPGVEDFRAPTPYLRLAVDGSIADTVHWSDRVGHQLVLAKGGVTHRWGVPFIHEAQIETLPDGQGILIAEEAVSQEGNAATIRLTALSPQRDTLWRRDFPITSIAIAPEHFAAAASRTPPRASVECSTGDVASAPLPTSEELAAAYRDMDGAREHLPALTALHIGQDGSIWLRREEAAADSTTWQLLDPSGEPVGFLTLPIGQRLIAARGDVFLVAEVGELDVPYLVRYRLAK